MAETITDAKEIETEYMAWADRLWKSGRYVATMEYPALLRKAFHDGYRAGLANKQAPPDADRSA